jgi:hypothetical protein
VLAGFDLLDRIILRSNRGAPIEPRPSPNSNQVHH